MLNFIGVCEHLSVLANVRWTSSLLFADDAIGAEVSLDGYTFEGEVATAGEPVALEFDREGASAGEIRLVVPPLERGRWDYEVRMRADTGDVVRLIYGKIAAVGAADEQTWGGRDGRTLCIHLPQSASEHVRLEWLAGSVAQAAADKAQQAADKAQQAADKAQQSAGEAASVIEEAQQKVDGAVDKITDRITEVYEQHLGDLTELKQAAENAITEANASLATAEKALEKVETLDSKLEAFKDHLREQIVIDPVTGEWVVAGVGTGVKAQGDHGVSPTVSTGYTWLVWDDETRGWVDTGISVLGKDGKAPYIDADGYWMQWDALTQAYVRTGVRAEGRDGIDGTAVRFILVASYDDIPQSGETCNGGFRYLVRTEGWAVIGDPAATGSGEWDALELPAYLLPSEFTHLRVTGVMNDNATPMHLAVRTAAGELLGLSKNAVTWNVGDVVTWEFADAVRVPNGATVQLFLSGPVNPGSVRMTSLIANEGVCRVRYDNVWYGERTPYLLAWGAGASDFYEVYAWVEHDGTSGWVRIDKTNELATSRVYGVMKYGTDMTVSGGAPVGRNADGQAFVPMAEYSMPGALKLGIDEAVENGSAIGRDADGRAVAVSATANRYGGVKCSMGEVAGCKCLGLTDDGSLGARWATLDQGGAVRLGSTFGQLNRIPYQQGVGATTDKQLSNNLLYSGALQHQKKAAWNAKQMPWLDAVGDTPYFNSDDYYTGLCTTNQFTQSESEGLSLNSATTSLSAGVYISVDMSDSRENAVPTGPMVMQWSLNTHFTKTQTMSSSQIEARITERICETHESIWQNLDACERTENLLARDYATNTRVTEVYDGCMNRADEVYDACMKRANDVYDGCIKVANGIDKWRVMNTQEFADLQTRDKNTLYIVTNA